MTIMLFFTKYGKIYPYLLRFHRIPLIPIYNPEYFLSSTF